MDKNKLKKLIDKWKDALAKKDAKIVDLSLKLKNAVKEDAVIFKMPEIVMPEKFNVANLPEIQKVRVVNPTDVQAVEIKNQPAVQKVEVVNRAEVTFPKIQKVEVINDKTAAWMPEIVVHSVKAISGMFRKLWDEGLTVRLASEERYKPQAVIIVDEKGVPVRAQSPSQLVIPMGVGGGRTKDPSPASAIVTGRAKVAVAGTRVQITATSVSIREVTICALDTNAGVVYVGGALVSAASGSESGILLEPTGSVNLKINDPSKIFVDSTQSNDAVTFTYLI